VDCRNNVTTEPFCLRIVKEYGGRPQGIAATELSVCRSVSRRCVPLEVVMSMQPDHHVDESEPGALSLALWVGAALAAMVAFSYWLNMA
jgi:hypothetical protein